MKLTKDECRVSIKIILVLLLLSACSKQEPIGCFYCNVNGFANYQCAYDDYGYEQLMNDKYCKLDN